MAKDDKAGGGWGLPVGEGAVEFASYGEVGSLVGVFGGEDFVDVDAEAGGVAGVHVASVEGVVVGEDLVGERGVVHVLLDAEVVDGEAEVQGGGHGDGGKVGGAVEAGADVVEGGEVGGLLEVGDAASVHDRHADVVDPLVADEVVGVPEGVEDFAGRDGGGGVSADELEASLEFGGAGVFEPEEVVRLEGFAKAGGFDGGEAVVDVVEEVDVGAELEAEFLEEGGDEVEVALGGPEGFLGQSALGRFVGLTGFGDAVAPGDAGDAGLGADGEVAFGYVALDGVESFGDVGAVGVGVDEDAFAAPAAEEVVDGGVERLALDVPESDVDGGDGGHGDGASAPVGSAVEVLPDVLGLEGVTADDAGEDVVLEVGGDGELAAVEGGVAEAIDPFVGVDAEGDEVAIGGAED